MDCVICPYDVHIGFSWGSMQDGNWLAVRSTGLGRFTYQGSGGVSGAEVGNGKLASGFEAPVRCRAGAGDAWCWCYAC